MKKMKEILQEAIKAQSIFSLKNQSFTSLLKKLDTNSQKLVTHRDSQTKFSIIDEQIKILVAIFLLTNPNLLESINEEDQTSDISDN